MNNKIVLSLIVFLCISPSLACKEVTSKKKLSFADLKPHVKIDIVPVSDSTKKTKRKPDKIIIPQSKPLFETVAENDPNKPTFKVALIDFEAKYTSDTISGAKEIRNIDLKKQDHERLNTIIKELPTTE